MRSMVGGLCRRSRFRIVPLALARLLSPGADVAVLSRVPAQMWLRRHAQAAVFVGLLPSAKAALVRELRSLGRVCAVRCGGAAVCLWCGFVQRPKRESALSTDRP